MGRVNRSLAVASLGFAALVLAPPPSRADEPPSVPAPVTSEPLPAPDTDPSHVAILKAVDEVREEVAKNRGLAWKSVVPAEVLTRAQFKVKLEELIKEDFDAKKYELSVKLARRLGMLRPDQDPLAIEKRFLSIGVAGYFDSKRKRFYVIEGLSPTAQRPTIVHELTHALDDQYFDLEARLEAVKDDSDKAFAIWCVVEGCAEHARMIYQAAHPDVAQLFNEEEAKGSSAQMAALEGVPAALVLPTLLHYQFGPVFVDAAVGNDFAGGMERLFRDPPQTEEQVLHPRKFLGKERDLPRKVIWGGDLAKAMGEGWTKIDDEVSGELDFSLWLDVHLGSTQGALNFEALWQGHVVAPAAKKAASGWDGMWIDTFEKAGLPLGIVIASAWDTDKDAVEAADAMLRALSKQYGSAFKGSGWKATELGRVSNWTAPNGAGRLIVRGDEVLLADGFPADDLTRLVAVLELAKFERDPGDTWDPAKANEPAEGVVWNDAKRGIGWKPPSDAWKFTAGEPGKPDEFTLTKGVTTVSVRVLSADLMSVARAFAPILMGNPKYFNPTKDITESKIAGATVVAIHFTEAAAGSIPETRHVRFLIGFDGGTVVASVAAERGIDAVAKDAEEAFAGFVYRD